jgi:hypothetical protein
MIPAFSSKSRNKENQEQALKSVRGTGSPVLDRSAIIRTITVAGETRNQPALISESSQRFCTKKPEHYGQKKKRFW